MRCATREVLKTFLLNKFLATEDIKCFFHSHNMTKCISLKNQMQKSKGSKWLDDEATMSSVINLTLEGDLTGSGRLGLSLEPQIKDR